MAPTTTTNSSIPLPTGEGFAGDEFSNNLFSDLAPLLTLFGEQVTKQFLSMSMGWADDVLLAMGPLGIMTVIVSAIRVSGIKTLKAFVGRARESRANAEKEILSSTSEDVCELWSGREIVRELGNPEGMKDIILLRETNGLLSHSSISTSSTFVGTRIFDINGAIAEYILQRPESLTKEEISDISNGAPNIALNVRNSTVSKRELLAWTVFGTILQISALAFPAVSTYYMDFKKGGSNIAAYGYPCFATGTIAIIVGVILCGRVIEGSTTEHDFEARLSKKVQFMRLQKACTVSDQHFSSYAIFNSPDDVILRTSRLNNKQFSRVAAAATLISVMGFVVQFVGLRALHWSATVYQLGVMVIMTAIRSLVRRGLAVDPIFYPVLDGHEIAWLTLYVIKNDQEDYTDDQPTAESSHNESSVSTSSNDVGSSHDIPLDNLAVHESSTQSPWSSSLEIERRSTRESSNRTLELGIPRIPSHALKPERDLQSHETDPEERMLSVIDRLEPLSGYFSVDRLRASIQEALDDSDTTQDSCNLLNIEDARLGRAFHPLATTWQLDADTIPMCDTHFLVICRDIRHLVAPPSSADENASNLALAMERTMALLQKSENILWKDRQHPMAAEDDDIPELGFNVSMVRGRYTPTATATPQNLRLRVKMVIYEGEAALLAEESYTEMWKADREILSSLISLWLFSLDLRRSAILKTAILLGRIHPEHWNERGFRHLINRTNMYYRIVASAPQPDETGQYTGLSGYDQSTRWLDTELDHLPRVGDYASTLIYSYSDKLDPLDMPWATWGSAFSGSLDSAHREDGNYNSAVLTRPETTIANQCALELFSYFMDAVAAKIDKLGGRTVVVQKSPGTDGTYWSNSVLESIANECVAAGLAHDVHEANTVIIPAFVKHGLLPEKLHDEEITWQYDETGSVVDPAETAVQPGSSSDEATDLRHEQTKATPKETVEPKDKETEIVAD